MSALVQNQPKIMTPQEALKEKKERLEFLRAQYREWIANSKDPKEKIDLTMQLFLKQYREDRRAI